MSPHPKTDMFKRSPTRAQYLRLMALWAFYGALIGIGLSVGVVGQLQQEAHAEAREEARDE